MATATIIDGKVLAQDLLNDLAQQVSKMSFPPRFFVIRVGDNKASEIYVRNKLKMASSIGISATEIFFDETVSTVAVLAQIEILNQDPSIHGIMVQLPLPKHLDEKQIISAILPGKDIDCMTPTNLGRLMAGVPLFYPATPAGILHILETTHSCLAGKHVVIIGRSNIVGKPLIPMLLQKNFTVTITHSKTPDFTTLTKIADIVIVAAGFPKLLTGSAIKKGATVIDVGINRIGGKLVGDVDFDLVKEKAAILTPVPGGVGPLTVAFLMKNIVLASDCLKN